MIADDPIQFAEKVLHLLQDEVLYRSMVSEARQFVVGQYDWDAITEKLINIYGSHY
jgi:glycosyltransferase involved in cell wall biosynthesis